MLSGSFTLDWHSRLPNLEGALFSCEPRLWSRCNAASRDRLRPGSYWKTRNHIGARRRCLIGYCGSYLVGGAIGRLVWSLGYLLVRRALGGLVRSLWYLLVGRIWSLVLVGGWRTLLILGVVYLLVWATDYLLIGVISNGWIGVRKSLLILATMHGRLRDHSIGLLWRQGLLGIGGIYWSSRLDRGGLLISDCLVLGWRGRSRGRLGHRGLGLHCWAIRKEGGIELIGLMLHDIYDSQRFGGRFILALSLLCFG